MSKLLQAVQADGGRIGKMWGIDLSEESPDRLGLMKKFEDARDGDAQESLTMLDASLAWRRKMNVESFREWKFRPEYDGHLCYLGQNFDGLPVTLANIANIDPVGTTCQTHLYMCAGGW
jgi:hypothetical protein